MELLRESFIAVLDFIARILIIPGDALRQLVSSIPLDAARGLFILYPILLLILIYYVPSSDMKGKLHGFGDRMVDVRPVAAIAMIMQVIIYMIF